MVENIGWQGRLQLECSSRAGKTVLTRCRHFGPIQVQRPFYPETGVAHVYLLHPPGGLVSGDDLQVDVLCRNTAQVLLTTPAACKFYRSSGTPASQTVSLQIEDGGELEWLPQETILFDSTRANTTLSVDLAPQARFIGWDIVCLGRPAAGESFQHGLGVMRLRLNRAGKPLLVEKFLLDGRCMCSNWGLQGKPAMATLLAHPFCAEHLQPLHDVLAESANVGLTLLDGLLVVRAWEDQVETIKQLFCELWGMIRPLTLSRSACLPRIWAT